MKLTYHALLRLHERAPEMFKKYNFVLEDGTKDSNQAKLHYMSNHMVKVDIPPDALGVVLHKMEMNKQTEKPTWYLLDDMVFIVHGDTLTTVHPCDNWTSSFIRKTSNQVQVKDFESLVQFACQNPSKVHIRFITSYNDEYNVVELVDPKTKIFAYVRKHKKMNKFELFNESEREYFSHLKYADKAVKSLKKGTLINFSSSFAEYNDIKIFHIQKYGYPYYAARNNDGYIAFLCYNNESPSVEMLQNDFASIYQMTPTSFVFFGVKKNNTVQPILNSDPLAIFMQFGTFSQNVDNKTLDAISKSFQKYHESISVVDEEKSTQQYEQSETKLNKVQILDKYRAQMSDEKFLKEFDYIGQIENEDYYRGYYHGIYLYAQKNPDGSIVFLDYNDNNETLYALLKEFENASHNQVYLKIMPDINFSMNVLNEVFFFHEKKLIHMIKKPSKNIINFLLINSKTIKDKDVEKMLWNLKAKKGECKTRANVGYIETWDNRMRSFVVTKNENASYIAEYDFFKGNFAFWIKYFIEKKQFIECNSQYLYENDDFIYKGFTINDISWYYQENKKSGELSIVNDITAETKLKLIDQIMQKVRQGSKKWNIVGGFGFKTLIIKENENYLYFYPQSNKLEYVPTKDLNNVIKNVEDHIIIQMIFESAELIKIEDTKCKDIKTKCMLYCGKEYKVFWAFDSFFIASAIPKYYNKYHNNQITP